MAKKSNRKDYEQAKKAADYYELKTQAVDDLVNTNVTNAPKVSEAERAKYRTRSRLNIPMWGKAVLLKWWLAGIVCWFFIFGLAIGSTLDQLVIAGIGLGVVTDLITNNLLRYMADPQGSNEKWIMVPKWKYISILVNVVYALLLVFLTFRTYTAVNSLLFRWTRDAENPLINVEPIGFGLVVMAWDMAFLGIKRVFAGIVQDAKKNAGR